MPAVKMGGPQHRKRSSTRSANERSIPESMRVAVTSRNGKLVRAARRRGSILKARHEATAFKGIVNSDLKKQSAGGIELTV
jgi:hypothetical protein